MEAKNSNLEDFYYVKFRFTKIPSFLYLDNNIIESKSPVLLNNPIIILPIGVAEVLTKNNLGVIER